ncbi:MAG: ABC transporter substrate-binding protein [Candidatus Caldatribacteriaceae bacterium]
MRRIHWLVILILSALLVAGTITTAGAQKKITVGVGGWAVDSLKQAIQELGFTEKTGIEVEVVTQPGSPPEFISQMTSAVMAGTSPYDVIYIEDEAAITFSRAGWLEPLDDLFDEAFWNDWSPDMLQMIEVWYNYQGELFRIPHNFEAQYFWYRKDLFDEKGLRPPEDWDEMVDAGKKLTNGDMWGVSDGLAKGAYLMVYTGYLTQQAGGNPFDFGEPLRTALQFLHDMMYTHKIFPVAALNKDYDALNQDYMNNRVAMMRQWPYFYDVARENKEWFTTEDKAAIALPPAGPAQRVTYAAAWGWIIPKTSAHKEEAKEFIKFSNSIENTPKLAKISTWYLNTCHSVLEAMGEEGMAKYLNWYSRSGVIGTRPFHPKFMEATSVVEDLVSAYLTNQITLDDLMKQGKEKMAALGSGQ